MNYQQFIITLKERVSLLLCEDVTIQTHTTLKNNGHERIGLTISDKNIHISPTIYLEEYFKQFTEGYSMEYIAQNIYDLYQEVKYNHVWNAHTIKDFSVIQSKIVYKVIHAEKNKTLLQNMPHTLYLDFAIVFYVLFEADESGTATIPITNELLHLWNTTTETLQKIAFVNTPHLLSADFNSMQTVINKILGITPSPEDQMDDIMFVLTNSFRTFGAACILYKGLLESIGNQIGENYYILPSSIHEVIIVPESQSPTREYLREMVIEINETQVEQEDFLSDSIYYYDGKILLQL